MPVGDGLGFAHWHRSGVTRKQSMAYSFLDLAIEVLKTAKQPFTYQEIWEEAKRSGLSARMKTSGKTPWQSLGAQLYVEVRDNPESRVVKVGKRPARFFLKDRESEISSNLEKEIQRGEAKRAAIAPKYKEKDLHPLLAYFAYSNPSSTVADPSIRRQSGTRRRSSRGIMNGSIRTWLGSIFPSKTGVRK